MIANLTQPEQTVWEQRFAAVWKLLQTIQERHKKNNKSELCPNEKAALLTRQCTITTLLGCLKEFGQTHFRFFIEGFTEKQSEGPSITLETTEALSANYIFGTILEQVSNDLAVIQRASEQRMLGELNMRQPTIDTFQIADQLAFFALKRIIHLLDPKSTVLTYLLKSPNVRVIPYAPVAMIGIPMTCYGMTIAEDSDETQPLDAGVGRDLLAIPHEIGHHLYWNGRKEEDNSTPENFLRNQLHNSDKEPKLPQWLANWVEEIFADVVSCWIGGPITALSFQDLQLQTRDDWFLIDNGVHPIAALRPYIYSETFRQLRMETVADQLEYRWNNKLQILGVLSQDQDPKQSFAFTPFHLPEDSKPERILNPLQEIINSGIINQCINVLAQQGNSINDPSAAMWMGNNLKSYNLSIEADVQRLYDDFEKWVKDTVAKMDSPPELSEYMEPWSSIVENRGVAFDIALPAGKDLLPKGLITLLRQWEGKLPQDDPDPIQLLLIDWRPIFEFAGWSTEGPTDGNINGQ